MAYGEPDAIHPADYGSGFYRNHLAASGREGMASMERRHLARSGPGEPFVDRAVFEGNLPPSKKQRREMAQKAKAKRARKAESKRRCRSADNYRSQITRNKRERVYARDGYRCVACGATKRLTLDHVIPIAKGGHNGVDNLQTMCAPCNQAKGCTLPPALV